MPTRSIGVFDSGVGGLTILKELISLLPHEHFIYLGDTARIPYGNKSASTVVRYSIEGSSWLLKKDIKLLVIACNTMSAYALEHLRQLFKVPVIGVIETGAKYAAAVSRNQRIAVIGTKGTINSKAHQQSILDLLPTAQIFPVACPLFVPLVEEKWLDHAATDLIIQEYLTPLLLCDIDTLLLGCTHYSVLTRSIRKFIGAHISIIDAASTCAEQVKNTLIKHQLHATAYTKPHQYYVSDDPEKFRILGEYIFGHKLESVKLVASEQFYME